MKTRIFILTFFTLFLAGFFIIASGLTSKDVTRIKRGSTNVENLNYTQCTQTVCAKHLDGSPCVGAKIDIGDEGGSFVTSCTTGNDGCCTVSLTAGVNYYAEVRGGTCPAASSGLFTACTSTINLSCCN